MESIQTKRFSNLRRATTIGAIALTMSGCSSIETETTSETAYFAVECQDGFEPEIIDVSDMIGEVISLECINGDSSARPLGISRLRERNESYEHILEMDYDDTTSFFESRASFDFSTNQDSDRPAYVRLHNADLTAVLITSNQE